VFDRTEAWWQTVITLSRAFMWFARDGANEERRESPTMSLASHLEELQRRHGDLEREIDEAMLHPSVDDIELRRLKRRKLAIKDQIEKLRASPTRH
jgi:hypothetical protein